MGDSFSVSGTPSPGAPHVARGTTGSPAAHRQAATRLHAMCRRCSPQQRRVPSSQCMRPLCVLQTQPGNSVVTSHRAQTVAEPLHKSCGLRSEVQIPWRACAAEELVALVQKKYKNKYDMTIARRDFAGKTFVSLNIMWVHMDQRSFPMSEEEYMDKCDGICMLLNVWGKQAQVCAAHCDLVSARLENQARCCAQGCTWCRKGEATPPCGTAVVGQAAPG